MKDFLDYLLGQLVDHPDKVDIQEQSAENSILFQVKLDKEDMGKVIGKEGKIIYALRNLLKVRGIKEGKMVRLELLDV